VKSRAEVKIVAASFALLMGLVVPVSAAVLDLTSAPEAGPSLSGSSFFLQGAPQPLLLMALGAVVVLIPVTRRARRLGDAASSADATRR